jgi:hypothetical protein
MFARNISKRGADLGHVRMTIQGIMVRPVAAIILLLTLLALPAHAARDGSTDRPGLDYRTFELSAPNPDLCENACKKERQCRSWTYAWPGAKGPKAMCALKTGVPPKRSDTCCISGVMATSSPVTRTDDPAPQPVAPDTPATNKADAPAPKPAAPAIAQPKPAPVVPKPPVTVAKPEPEPDPTPRTTIVPKPKPPVPADVATNGDDGDETPAQPQVSDARLAQCRDYAQRAVAQNQENSSLRCGLSGSRWGFGYDAYYNFCANNPDNLWQSARRARDSELERCKARIAARRDDGVIAPDVDVDLGDLFNGNGRDRQFCRNYAEQSVLQAGEARRLDCGFSGSRWSSSRVRQARLCEDIGPREAAQLLRSRARQLDTCRADSGDGFGRAEAGLNCRAYARQSVQQARAARRLDCGYRGARWTTNFRAHLRWCQQVSPGESAAELRLRDDFLYRCE